MNKITKKSVFYILTFCIAICLLVVGLKVIDLTIVALSQNKLIDETSEVTTMRTYEYYPYTENHIQAYTHEKGKLGWTNFYDDFNVLSGDHGFFVDFNIDQPPPKRLNEYRIILIGGSAAQGWGGRTNDDMFYKLLEKELNFRLQARHSNYHVRVINLAMAGSVTLQNFLVLNKWGHNLKPDLILSFSGHNEIAVPFNTFSDSSGSNLGGMTRASRYSESPKWLKWLASFYPGFTKYTKLSFYLNFSNLGYHQSEWNLRYFLSHYDPDYQGNMSIAEMQMRYQTLISTKHNTLNDVAIPLYLRGLQSIKRDFSGIPMVIAFQPILSKNDRHYDPMIKAVTEGMTNYLNSDNHIVSLQRIWELNDFYNKALVDSVHLSNEGHTIVSRQLSDFIFPIVKDLRLRDTLTQDHASKK